MFVRQAPGEEGREGAIIRLVSVIAIATLRIRHVAYGWHQSQHSTVHCAAQHNTNINFPSAHNKYSLLLLLLFSACHIFLRPPPVFCPEYFTHLLRLVECECICLAFCQFSKHFSFAFYVQFFQFSHRKCFDKYAQLEFWSGRERAKETRTEWEWGRGSKCCLRNLIAQSWFANMQFGCRQSEKSFEIFSVMNISISRSAQFWFPKTFITPVCLSPFLSRSLSLSLQFNQFDCYGSQVR